MNNKLKSNVIFSAIFQLLFFIAPMITTPYVARIFNPEALGIYATTFSLATLFVQIANFGIPIYGVRIIAQSQGERERTSNFISIWVLQILITILISALYSIICMLFFKNFKIYIVQGLLILASLFDLSWFFTGIEEIKRTIFRNVLTKILTILLILTFVNHEGDLIKYILINVFGVFAGNLSMCLQIFKFLDFSNFKFSISKNTVMTSFGLLLPQLIDSLKSNFSRVILAKMASYSAVGFFDQGNKITTMLNGIFGAVTNSILPRIASNVKKGKNDEIEKITRKFLTFNKLFVLIIISGIFNISQFFVPFFFGEGYSNIVFVLNISGISILFSSLSYYFGKAVLISNSLDKEYRKVTLLSCLLLMFFSVLLDGFLHEKGAAISYTLATFFQFLLIINYSRKFIDIIFVKRNLFENILCIVINVFVIKSIQLLFLFKADLTNFLLYGFLSVLASISLYFLSEKLKKHYFC